MMEYRILAAGGAALEIELEFGAAVSREFHSELAVKMAVLDRFFSNGGILRERPGAAIVSRVTATPDSLTIAYPAWDLGSEGLGVVLSVLKQACAGVAIARVIDRTEVTMANSKSKAKQKYRVGSIIAIPLPQGKFAFAKVFKNFDLGVYDYVADEIEPLAEVLKHKIAFFQAAGDAPIKSGEWPVIGEQLFPDEEAAWGPPRASGVIPGYRIDPMMLRIRHKDVARRATLEEAAGMDIETFAQRPELLVDILVDRLIKGNHDKYRIPQ